jgi:hypothetical protein
MLLSFVYLALMFAIQLRPVWYYIIKDSDRIQNSLYAIAAILLTALVGLLPLELGWRRLARGEFI